MAVAFNFFVQRNAELSDVFKFLFCGVLLRSKTSKARLENCLATKWRCL